MNYEKESFPVKLTAKTTTAGGTILYSWTEQVIGGTDGLYTDQVSARTGTNNAREKNNADLTLPYYASLDLEGSINGALYYTFSPGGTSGAGPGFSGARFVSFPNQTIPSGSTTDLTQTGGTTNYDVGGYTQTLKAPVAGYYRGMFQVEFPATGSPYTVALYSFTSSAQQLGNVYYTTINQITILQLAWEGHLVLNEAVRCQAYQNSGASQSVQVLMETIESMAGVQGPAGAAGAPGSPGPPGPPGGPPG